MKKDEISWKKKRNPKDPCKNVQNPIKNVKNSWKNVTKILAKKEIPKIPNKEKKTQKTCKKEVLKIYAKKK